MLVHINYATNKWRQQDDDDSSRGGWLGSSSTHGAQVARVGATRVGDDGRFLVTVECERRDGVAAHLCAAIESLACFRVESSSLGRSAPDRVMSTATLKVTMDSYLLDRVCIDCTESIFIWVPAGDMSSGGGDDRRGHGEASDAGCSRRGRLPNRHDGRDLLRCMIQLNSQFRQPVVACCPN